MTNVRLTESECIDFLVTKAKSHGELAPKCVTINRTIKGDPKRTLSRVVRFALIVSTDNETLLNDLLKDCLDSDFDVYFVGSDVNFQIDLEIDYLFFEALIFVKT